MLFSNYVPKNAIQLWIALLTIVFSSPIANAWEDSTASFVNDIVPILTKAGCNSGQCHAKAGGGQNGFQLSLLGFEPTEDFEHLVKEGHGRRLFPAAPQQSLLLLKATGDTPHRGGARIQRDSKEYQLLLEWIRSGARWDGESAPKITSIEVVPSHALMQVNETIPLQAIVHYSDGTKRDITSLALFEANDRGMADVDGRGQVHVLDKPGKVAIMVRYQGKVSVFNASILHPSPEGSGQFASMRDQLPPPKNFIDVHVFKNLEALHIPPSGLVDDSTFLRRATLDIAGRIPTREESTKFLNDTSIDKRDAAIDRLLSSPDYADFFANKWTALLKNRRDDASDIKSNFAFHAWIRDNMLTNKPYDQFVRELLAATGTVQGNPPVAWYKRVKEPKQQLEDVAQLFLGVRMQCAQCHHHPFERWSQDDYYSMAAFFSQIGRKPSNTRGEDLIFHKRGVATAKNVKTGLALKPAAFGDSIPEIASDEDPRLKLVDWMSSPENPFFAKALVNRYWKHFFQRGLIEPEDDIRDSNPPTNPELLTALEKHFVANHFDLRDLIKTITTSNAYQLSSSPLPLNTQDLQNYSHYYPRRLQAESMLDAIDALCESQTDFPNLPTGTKAIALPDNSYNVASPFLKVFGRPESESVCECERVQSSSLAQSLHLINAADIKNKIARAGGRADRLSQESQPLEDKVREIYLAALSRQPRENELQVAVEYLKEPRSNNDGNPMDPATATFLNFQDLIWALINTKEFLFNH